MNKKRRNTPEVLLSVQDLHVRFDTVKGYVYANSGISFDLYAGETLGIVGESGCGKSTLGRAILALIEAHKAKIAGQILYKGENIAGLDPKAMKFLRRDMQIIFQDPLASLDPRMTVGAIIAEPLEIHFPKMPKAEVLSQVKKMMFKVGLLPEMINRYPHEFSGGQAQRIGIARALILKPKIIVCDEPVSALDVSIQAQIINLLMDLQQEMGLSLIFISHDLSVVRHISHRIMVLYLGKVMELADKQYIYERPKHPYTEVLLSAVPVPDPRLQKAKKRIALQGDLPSPLHPPKGCVFHTRCPYAQERCRLEAPQLQGKDEQSVACHFA